MAPLGGLESEEGNPPFKKYRSKNNNNAIKIGFAPVDLLYSQSLTKSTKTNVLK
jgi:hypothetical protein